MNYVTLEDIKYNSDGPRREPTGFVIKHRHYNGFHVTWNSDKQSWFLTNEEPNNCHIPTMRYDYEEKNYFLGAICPKNEVWWGAAAELRNILENGLFLYKILVIDEDTNKKMILIKDRTHRIPVSNWDKSKWIVTEFMIREDDPQFSKYLDTFNEDIVSLRRPHIPYINPEEYAYFSGFRLAISFNGELLNFY